MRLPTALLAAAAALLLTTSGCVMQMTPAFDPLGSKADRYAEKSAADMNEVRIFTDTAPSGFQLRDGTLVVEPGHRHRIVGRLTVNRNGSCRPRSDARTSLMTTLRREAFIYGGNAVVFATTPIRENATSTDLCKQLGTETVVGAGWVVVIGERAPDKAPPPAKKPARAAGATPAAPKPAPPAPEAPAAQAPTAP